jgi:hypothetical protein
LEPHHPIPEDKLHAYIVRRGGDHFCELRNRFGRVVCDSEQMVAAIQ